MYRDCNPIRCGNGKRTHLAADVAIRALQLDHTRGVTDVCARISRQTAEMYLLGQRAAAVRLIALAGRGVLSASRARVSNLEVS